MAARLQILNAHELTSILRVFAALDGVRWRSSANYNLINYCADDLTADERLLTHWLSYITDRQTAFERVWDVGGYVLSHLVRSFTRDRRTPRRAMLDHLRGLSDDTGLRLVCKRGDERKQRARLARYDEDHDPVGFASRYMPSDVIAIYRTLVILDAVTDRSFIRYMALAVTSTRDQRAAVLRLAVALHLLTYADVGQVDADGVGDRIRALPRAINGDIAQLKTDPATFLTHREKGFLPHGKKRLWCSVRDYLKSPEFNGYFNEALRGIAPTEAGRWAKEAPALRAALDVIELPGDVWNNNHTFRDGLFVSRLGPIPKTWDMPRTIRAIYEGLSSAQTIFYPEQLDVTFDFVPRMCGKMNCNICLFGSGVAKLYHGKPGLYCPVTLAACGYIHTCSPASCFLKGDKLRGVCRRTVTRAASDAGQAATPA